MGSAYGFSGGLVGSAYGFRLGGLVFDVKFMRYLITSPRRICIATLNKGDSPIECQLYGGKPWTILKTSHCLRSIDAIQIKQDNLTILGSFSY